MNTNDFLQQYGLFLENMLGVLFFGTFLCINIFSNISEKSYIKAYAKIVIIIFLSTICIVIHEEKWYITVFFGGFIFYCFIANFLPEKEGYVNKK